MNDQQNGDHTDHTPCLARFFRAFSGPHSKFTSPSLYHNNVFTFLLSRMIIEADRPLKHALRMHRGPWTEAETERIRALLDKAARDVIGGNN